MKHFYLTTLLLATVLLCGACKKAPKPVISSKVLDDGTIEVTITASGAAHVYFTTDGSLPTPDSRKYEEPFLIKHTAAALHNPGQPGTDRQEAIRVVSAIAVEGANQSMVVHSPFELDRVLHRFNLSYKKPGTEVKSEAEDAFDIYYPKDTGKPSKVVFIIPGRGWEKGNKNLYYEFANTLTGCYSYITVVINYRSSLPAGTVKHPDHIMDVAEAFDAVYSLLLEDSQKAGGERIYNGDMKNVFICGHSAGAYLASLLMLDARYLTRRQVPLSTVAGVICLGGLFDLNGMTILNDNPLGLTSKEAVFFSGLLLNSFGPYDEKKLVEASPVTYADRVSHPFLLIYSIEDGAGVEIQNRMFYNKLNLQPGYEQLVKFKSVYYSTPVWRRSVIEASKSLDSDILAPGHYAQIAAVNTAEWDWPAPTHIAGFIENNSR